MAKVVFIISKTGTGKSSSLRNFKRGEAQVVSCSGKELPFKSDLPMLTPKNYGEVYKAIDGATAPVVVIDDANYLMSFEEISRVNEVGYQKFTQMAQNFFNVVKRIIDKPGEQIFYILAHAEDNDEGTIRIKTTGKMLSEKVVLEGLTNILLTNEVKDGEFVFKVKTDGSGVKSPMDMFESDYISNDLKEVDKTIRGYYDMKPLTAPNIAEKPKPTKEAK